MHNIEIFVESRYPVKRKRVRRVVEEVLRGSGIKSKTEVSVSIVGERKMAGLNRKYRGEEGATPVLAFSQGEGEDFPDTQGDVLSLGDVVISYPQAREIAKRDNELVGRVIEELVKHGVKQLCSI